jgi:5-methylcytosine-specific restriction endonuclease McrA
VRACICGRIAVSGTSRCRAHTTYGWGSKPKSRDAAYADPAYRRNRGITLRREPSCHWRLPGCTGRSTTADHLVAVSRGGSNDLGNLVGSCRHCNEARGRDLGNQTKTAPP